MADPEQYREWAAQQINTRIRDRMLDEADRIEARRAAEAPRVVVSITIGASRG